MSLLGLLSITTTINSTTTMEHNLELLSHCLLGHSAGMLLLLYYNPSSELSHMHFDFQDYSTLNLDQRLVGRQLATLGCMMIDSDSTLTLISEDSSISIPILQMSIKL
jgi:hypothetical protein